MTTASSRRGEEQMLFLKGFVIGSPGPSATAP